jgi:hypothetical protein
MVHYCDSSNRFKTVIQTNLVTRTWKLIIVLAYYLGIMPNTNNKKWPLSAGGTNLRKYKAKQLANGVIIANTITQISLKF